MTDTVTRRPGRPRSFDTDVVLEQILDVFWERGFDSTSMADLSAATSVNWASLYATFGNKEAMFLRAVELYVSQNGATSGQMLRSHSVFREAIRALLHSQVDLFTRFDPPRGCLVVKSFTDAATVSESTRERLRQHRRETGDAILARVVRARDDGEIRPDEDVDALAEMIHVFQNGLTVQVTDGVPPARLRAAIDRLCAQSL